MTPPRITEAKAIAELALSVRQPWAWAIIHAGKDIENRNWRESNLLRQRGRIAIHAAKGMTKEEYVDAEEWMRINCGVKCPYILDLDRGGIIGSVELVDIVRASESSWFIGPLGLALRDPQPCEFIPARGALGFFKWKEN